MLFTHTKICFMLGVGQKWILYVFIMNSYKLVFIPNNVRNVLVKVVRVGEKLLKNGSHPIFLKVQN